jgi:AsmA protein
MKLFKILLSAIAILVLLVIVLVAVFVATFDANEYKQELSDLVLDRTGRDLTFKGDIGLTLYPALGMNLGSMELSNAAGFGVQPMVAVSEASASVDVLSILSFQPEIAQLVLDGLQVDLQKNAEGVTNWDDLLPAETAEDTDQPAQPDAEQAPAGEPTEPMQFAGAFGGINVTNANIRWRDAQAGVEYQVSDLSMLTGRIELDEEFPLSLRLSAASAGQATADIELDSRVLFLDQVLTLSDLKLKTRASGELIPVDQVQVDTSANVEFSLDKNLLKVRGLNLKVVTQGGLVKATDTTLGATVDFDLNRQQLKVGGLSIKSRVDDPGAPEQGGLTPVDQIDATVKGEVDMNLNDMQLGLSGFDTRVQTSGGLLDSSDVGITGEIGFDLNQQQLVIGALDLAAKAAGELLPTGKIEASVSSSKLDLKLKQRALKLDDLVLAVDGNRFEGFVNVLDYTQPAVDFKLQSDNLNVDQLTGWQRPPPAAETETPPPAAPVEPAADLQIALPMDLLRQLGINGELGIGRVIAQGLTFENLKLVIKAKDGLIRLNPLALDLYDGSFRGDIGLDASGDRPKYSINKQLAGFQFGDFLKDFMQQDPVSGAANLDIELRTSGEWLSELKKNANGKVAVSIDDGALTGFNLRHEIDKAKARLQGEKIDDQTARKTDFSSMSLSGVIKNGVFSSDDLNLQAPALRVGGAGKVDLVGETVDYLVKAKIVGTTKAQGVGGVDDLSGLLVPVKITGPWLTPKIDVQYDELLKSQLEAEKARIAAEVEQEKARLQKKLADEKARLEAAKEKEIAEQKARLAEQKKQAAARLEREKAAQRKKLEAEMARKKAELDKKKEAEKNKLEDKLKEKLKLNF